MQSKHPTPYQLRHPRRVTYTVQMTAEQLDIVHQSLIMFREITAGCQIVDRDELAALVDMSQPSSDDAPFGCDPHPAVNGWAL